LIKLNEKAKPKPVKVWAFLFLIIGLNTIIEEIAIRK